MYGQLNLLLATACIVALIAQGDAIWASSCTARPYEGSESRNIITVPPNCPNGQVWVNGQCRDVWRAFTVEPRNVITVPSNCPPGQELVNGICRDVWRRTQKQEDILGSDIWRPFTVEPRNVITVPSNCPPGQELVNGICRDVWRRTQEQEDIFGEFYADKESRNVISTPPNCRPGQVLVNGQCRDLWRIIYDSKNVIEVPPNCPPGQQLVNGQCRDVWRSSNVMDTSFENWRNMLSRREIERRVENGDSQFGSEDSLLTNNNSVNKNIINVPNQCPVGFRPDALGICRPIL